MRGCVAVLMVSCVVALALVLRGFLRTRHRVLVPVVPLVERSNPSRGNVSLRLDNASYFESSITVIKR